MFTEASIWKSPLFSDLKVNGREADEIFDEIIEKRLVAFKKRYRRPPSEDEEEKIYEDEEKKFEDKYGVEPKYEEAKFLTSAFLKFKPIQDMERLARAIAVMNWLSDSLGKNFPKWPANAKPTTIPIVAELNPVEVLSPKHKQ